MRLEDSVPLLKKLSDLTSIPVLNSLYPSEKTSSTQTNHLKEDIETITSPGLPKSPRSNFSPEIQSEFRRPVLKINTHRSDREKLGPFSSETDMGTRTRTGSTTPTARRKSDNISPAQSINLQADSRDDSHYGSVGQNTVNSSVYFSPLPASSQNGEEMEDVMIHRYLNEKSKVRASEARNTILHSHIDELSKHIDELCVKANNDKLAAENKLSEQEQLTASIETANKDLQDQIFKQSVESERQIEAIKDDAQKGLESVRKEGENVLRALRDEMSSLQTKYTTSQKMHENEKKNIVDLNTKLIEIEKREEEGTKALYAQAEEANSLKLKITQTEKESSELRDALDNVNEMLDFQNSKASELSNELRLMSYQYVKSIEKLGADNLKSEKLSRELDRVEEKLKTSIRKNVVISNQLEEMARGYIETDELLEKEKEDHRLLAEKFKAVEEDFAKETSRTKELTMDMKKTTMLLQESTEETLKLTGLCTALSTEASSVKKTLAKALAKVKSITKKQKESEELRVEAEGKVKKEQEYVSQLEIESQSANEKNEALLQDLNDKKIELGDIQAAHSSLTVEYQENITAYDSIVETLKKERSATQCAADTIASMRQEVNILQEQISSQNLIATRLKLDLQNIKDERDCLLATVKEKNEEYAAVKGILETEQDEYRESKIEYEETMATLSSELESLEKKHAGLFDNLVDTEAKLQVAEETLENTSVLLEKKNAEFGPIENMLREEISSKEDELKKYRSEIREVNKKCSIANSDLANSEERALKLQEHSQLLQNDLLDYKQKCKKASLSLERQKNGPVQRKLKVAKRMIKAEKDRYQAILKEIEAKNLIIGRIENQSKLHKSQLQETQHELKAEKENKVTYSGRALQDLRKQLEDERKIVKKEKEALRSKLQGERSKVKSLTLRVAVAEGSSEGGAEISQVLKEQHTNNEQVRVLTEQNDHLLEIVKDKREAELLLKDRMSVTESKLKEITNSLDCITQYCSGLEEEKRILVNSLENARNPSKGFCGIAEDDDSDYDEDTLDGRSLSDFSIAQIPAPRQTQRDFLLKRTLISQAVSEEDSASGEHIELTVDAGILYD